MKLLTLNQGIWDSFERRQGTDEEKRDQMLVFLLIAAAVILMLIILALTGKCVSTYRFRPGERNPMEGKRVRFVADENERENADGVRGYLEACGAAEHKGGFYEIFIKRCADIVMSFFGLVLLSPVFLVISVWILIDDPGPIFFSQKRIGKNKRFFKLHKFRSMKMSTPHDKPTHMLENPEQYITRTG